ncbi:MAG TPA: hypothetical protein ENF99_00240, partial [Candidatus Aenigmarchaeota archaeon]|nr:hypothetical protein [Candidatus Aenigmarchaeota archaeon]
AREILNSILGKYFDRIELLEYEGRKSETLTHPLAKLSDYERKTFEAMLKLKKADASQVSKITKRARAVESHYLNILVRKGYLEEERLGRRKIFRLPEKFQELPESYKEM